MKRPVLAGLLIAGLALSVFAAPPGRRSTRKTKIPEPEILREIKPEDIQPGMRVRIRLHHGRGLVGSILRVTDKMVELDLSTEPAGLPGKLRQTPEEDGPGRHLLDVAPQSEGLGRQQYPLGGLDGLHWAGLVMPLEQKDLAGPREHTLARHGLVDARD